MMVVIGNNSAISTSEIKNSRRWILNPLNKSAVATVE
jgi:ribosomal protein L28